MTNRKGFRIKSSYSDSRNLPADTYRPWNCSTSVAGFWVVSETVACRNTNIHDKNTFFVYALAISHRHFNLSLRLPITTLPMSFSFSRRCFNSCIFMIISRRIILKIINISNKYRTENQTHFMFNNLFFQKYRLWGNVEKYGTAGHATDIIKWRMRFACWVNKATNTHPEYVILIVCLRQK